MAKEQAAKVKDEEITLFCSNKALTIAHLGVQFKDGQFSTKDRKLADMILKYDAVFEK